MPVLGGASTSGGGNGNLARGVVAPAGSLDTFKAALKAHATQRCEIVLLGDSTDDGANDFGGANSVYPWAMRLLDRLRADGVTYGGRGLFSQRASVSSSSPGTKDPDGYPIVSAKDASGFTEGTNSVNGWSCSTAGKTITLQGTGTSLRVNLMRGVNSHAKIGVTIDGATETVYDTGLPAPLVTGYDVLPQVTTGLTEGVHTVVIRHAGGADIKDPSAAAVTWTTGAGSGPTAGTYWYAITAVSANGESLKSTPQSLVLNGSQIPQVNYYAQYGWTQVNMYRATTQNGTYGLVGSSTGVAVPGSVGAAKNNFQDTTGSGTPGAAPPSTSTLGQMTGQTAAFGIEFFRNTGVIVHNEGIFGQSFDNFISHYGTSATAWRGYTPARFGLQSETQAALNRVPGFLNGLPKGANPQYRDVKLVIFKLGTNDIAGWTTSTPSADGQNYAGWYHFIENVSYGVRTARAAGADVLLISPPFTNAADPGGNHYMGRFKSALLQVALSHGAAYVDFQEALGWDAVNFGTKAYQGASSATANPHLLKGGYQAQADYLYDQLIHPLLIS